MGALLRLYYHPRIEMKKQKNYVTNCTTNYSSKNLAVTFLLYVLEHTNLASTIKKKKKTLKSYNTPPIKIVANKKKYSNLHQLQNQLLLNVVVAVQKKYLCDRLKTPKMASGHYWKVQ